MFREDFRMADKRLPAAGKSWKRVQVSNYVSPVIAYPVHSYRGVTTPPHYILFYDFISLNFDAHPHFNWTRAKRAAVQYVLLEFTSARTRFQVFRLSISKREYAWRVPRKLKFVVESTGTSCTRSFATLN